MSNYDFVRPYDARMKTWLAARGYPHPNVKPRNRFPTRQELFDAIEASGTLETEGFDFDDDEEEFFAVEIGTPRSKGYEIRIQCFDGLGESSNDAITMHGNIRTELTLLELLSHTCGQLLLYPDTGDPAVVVEPGMDVARVYSLWTNANRQLDPWEYFYRNMGYRPARSSPSTRAQGDAASVPRRRRPKTSS